MVLLVSSVPRTRTETPKAAPFRRWTKQQRADQSRATGPTEKLQEWGRELAGGADLEERVAAVRRRAVGADAGAAPEAEDVLLVLLAGLVRGAADEEGLRDQAGDPPAGHHPRLSIPRRTGSPAPPPLGRLGREGGRNSLSLSSSSSRQRQFYLFCLLSLTLSPSRALWTCLGAVFRAMLRWLVL
jgi:hypothetical protein